MTTTVIYADAEDGYIQSQDATYTTARAGSSLLAGGTLVRAGQSENGAGTYTIYEGFVSFDTSVVGDSDTVSAVTLELYVTSDLSGTDFTVQARDSNWGATLTTTDWVAGADLGALTLLGTLATAGVSASAYNAFAENGSNFQSWVNKTGSSYILLNSSRHEANTAPGSATNEYLNIRSSENAGTTQDPKITITHSPPPRAPVVYHHALRVWTRSVR